MTFEESKSLSKMTSFVEYKDKGHIAGAFTPFSGDSAERLNLAAIPAYAKFFADHNLKSLIINGTVAEGMAMNVEERIKTAEAWREATKQNGQTLMIHVGGTNLQDVKKLAAHAQSIKADALLTLPELYYRPKTVDDLIQYLIEIAESAPQVPLFYYHSPEATSVTVNIPEFFDKIRASNKLPTFAGIKFATGNLDHVTTAVKAAGKRFRVIVATNHLIPACVNIGVDTFMPTSINFAPILVNDIYKSAMNGDYAKAQTLQFKLVDLMDKLEAVDTNVSPVMKAVLRGLYLPKFDIGTTRNPIRSYDSVVKDTKLVSHFLKEF